jgi:GT2 family glycosyltransferase/glycosyltransferase involved in cell wall biosynthesis
MKRCLESLEDRTTLRESKDRPGFWRRLERSIRKRRKWLQAWVGFDRGWYLNSYPDVAAAGIDALSHYMNYGIKEGRFKNSKDEKKARLVRTGTQQNIEITSDLESRSRSTRKVFIPSNFLQDFGTVQTDIRAIALYLPQFHAVRENDEWWGKGFTDWTNVRRGTPQYEGHYQPHVPHQDLGYYDLNAPSVMEKQASMAKAAGIEGFCFYYYWFNGKRLLNLPTDRILASGKPNFPFCFCWANENWTRTWDGLDRHILMEQKHSPEDNESFICELLPALRDRRYIRVDGKPLLVVYRPGLLPSPAKTAARWRRVCRKKGLGEICLAFMSGFDDFDPAEIGFDAVIQMPPLRAQLPLINGAMQLKNPGNFSGEVRDYRRLSKQFCSLPEKNSHWPAVCPSWDNTARRMEQAHSFAHATPESYFLWLENVVEKLRKSRPEGQRIVFINAWNEWGEGCHLEPDEKFGYAWLNATRSALSSQQESQSFKWNPLVAQTLRNKAHFLTGTQAKEQHDDFLAEHAALLGIFRSQGNTFNTSDMSLLGKDKKDVFSIQKRPDLEYLSRAVFGDLEVMPFCFVLLQYNKCERTLKCVESIKRLGAESHPIQIIIVDNASSEDEVAKTRELFGHDKNISLIFNLKNLGFSGGNNTGYRYARESFGDAFIVVMNNDNVIHDSKFVAKCFQLFRDWSYSVLGPDIVTPEGRRENPWNDYVYGPDGWNNLHNLYVHQKKDYLKKGRAAHRRLGERNPQKRTFLNPILQGACYIFSPIFTCCHQRPFDESIFLYGEEFPLAIDCLTSGHLMLYSSELAVVHEEGVSTGLLKEQQKMLHSYDGALKGIELSSLRLQRHGDATVGRPIGFDACLIRNLTSDGRRHVLIDLFFCQPGFHGGGEYGKAVFSGLIEEQLRHPDIQIWAAIDPDLFIDEWVWDECRRFAINIVRVKSYDDIVKLVNMNCFYSFFAPAIVVYTGYEYMKRVGGDLKFDDITTTRIVGALLDLRDFELASQWESIAEARRKAGCSPELELTPERLEAEKARQEKKAQELALMYQRICRHKALKTLITISSHSAESIKKNAHCSQPVEVLFAPEKKRAKPESFIWSGIDFENDLYLVMLNAGRLEKNAASAVAAFDKLFYQSDFAIVNPNLKLVLVGLNKASDLGVKKPREHRRIVALPHLSPARLEYLLTKARGLIYPSFNEGFGYPPLEAMSVGVPCVVSDCTSLPEVCGDAVIYCNPLDVDSIADGIKKTLRHQPKTQKLKEQAAKVKSRQAKDLAILSSLICGISEDSVHTKVAAHKFNRDFGILSPVALGGRG